MAIRREIHPTRQRILKKLQELGPMTKYQIAEECFVSFRNVNEYLKLMHDDLEVHIHSWVRSGSGGGSWTKVWGYGDGRDARRPRALTPAEKARKYRAENPEATIKDMLKKRSKRFKERMSRIHGNSTGSTRQIS